MRIKHICSFILVYFVTSGLVLCDEAPKPVVVQGNLVNETSVLQNATSNPTNTTSPPPQSSTKPKSVPKKEATEKPTIIANSTKATTPTTSLPTKQNSSTANVIATEGGVISIPTKSSAQTVIALNSTKATSPPLSTSSTSASSNTTTSSTSSTSTTTTTTTKAPSTTTIPKKPKMTFSSDDQPDYPKEKSPSEDSQKIHDDDGPRVESSKEQFNPHRDFVVPLVTLIFALPIFLGVAVIGYRKVRDYWSTRHYRRMDFLVDGMYND